MKILVTGSKGFVGKNLVAQLVSIRDGKDRIHTIPGGADTLEIVEYGRTSKIDELDTACRDCDFVFNLAGVNRPEDPAEFIHGNIDFPAMLLDLLKKHHNKCPVMFSSSIQASLIGRYEYSDYGKSKLIGEQLFFKYAEETGAKVLIYRFPNLFGKWCRPNYNSVVATFCHNIAHDLPIQVNNHQTELKLVYIDDLIEELLLAVNGREHRCSFNGLNPVADINGKYCYVPMDHKVTLGEIVTLLEKFHNQPQNLLMPDIPTGSFAKKLYSTYLSYIPKDKVLVPLKMQVDMRGSFTELLKTKNCGQFSVNISNPGITKGEHWHHSKWEFFIVVSGHALIQERRIGTKEILEFEVSDEKIEAVHVLPGYAHKIINLSNIKPLVTIMWANEIFEPQNPDTYREDV